MAWPTISKRDLRRVEVLADVITVRYRFFATGAATVLSTDMADPAVKQGLTAAITLALSGLEGIEGSIWEREAGVFCYAFPTYEGGAAKTDLPAAERPRIEEVAGRAAAVDQELLRRFDARGQILFIAACPLPPDLVPELAGNTRRSSPPLLSIYKLSGSLACAPSGGGLAVRVAEGAGKWLALEKPVAKAIWARESGLCCRRRTVCARRSFR